MIIEFTVPRSLVWGVCDLQVLTKNKNYYADWKFSYDDATPLVINIQLIVRDDRDPNPVTNIIDDTHIGPSTSLGLDMSPEMETVMVDLVRDYMKI